MPECVCRVRSAKATKMNGPLSHRVTEINAMTARVIGSAIEVHRVLGPGLHEMIYETALTSEFDEAGISYELSVIIGSISSSKISCSWK
jgi:hypothetical protein